MSGFRNGRLVAHQAFNFEGTRLLQPMKFVEANKFTFLEKVTFEVPRDTSFVWDDVQYTLHPKTVLEERSDAPTTIAKVRKATLPKT